MKRRYFFTYKRTDNTDVKKAYFYGKTKQAAVASFYSLVGRSNVEEIISIVEA